MLLNKIRKLQKKFSKTGFIMASLLGGEVLLSVGCLSGHRIVRSVQLKQEEVSDAAIGANADTISPEIFKRKLILIQCILGRTFAANIKVFTAYRKAVDARKSVDDILKDLQKDLNNGISSNVKLAMSKAKTIASQVIALLNEANFSAEPVRNVVDEAKEILDAVLIEGTHLEIIGRITDEITALIFAICTHIEPIVTEANSTNYYLSSIRSILEYIKSTLIEIDKINISLNAKFDELG